MKMFEISQSTLKIERALKLNKPGDFIFYEDLATLSDVIMDNKGKGYMRTALKRMNLEYLCHSGKGIELVSEHSAISAINNKIIRIDNAVKRGHKTHCNINNQFYEKLSPADKQRADFVGAVFAIIRSQSNSARKSFRDTPPKIGNSKIDADIKY